MAVRYGAGSANLSVIITQLRAMTQDKMNGVYRGELSKAARPLTASVRAAIINTPSGGQIPYPPQVPGLRLRIAACVETWAKIEGDVVTAGVEVNSSRMPDGQKSLPLMLQGAKIWRHPVFGDIEKWVGQASHPYFYQATAFYGPAARRAVEKATADIAAQIDG